MPVLIKKEIQLSDYKSSFYISDAREIHEGNLHELNRLINEANQRVVDEICLQVFGKDYSQKDVDLIAFSRSFQSECRDFDKNQSPIKVMVSNLMIGTLEFDNGFDKNLNEYYTKGYRYQIYFRSFPQFKQALHS